MPDIPVTRISRAINNAQKQVLYSETYEDLAPMSTVEVDSIVQYLFPDSVKSGVHRLAYLDSFGAKPNFQKECLSSLIVILKALIPVCRQC